jgi:hypothetical protein
VVLTFSRYFIGVRRILRPGTVLLVAGIVLLGIAAVHRVSAGATPRVLSDRAAFARYAATIPGRFQTAHVIRRSQDRVCAVHVRPRYRLCGIVHVAADGTRVFRPSTAARS